jgi:hypothetical protein
VLQPYAAQAEGDDLELPPGAPRTRRRSSGHRVDPVKAGIPVFVSEARGAMCEADVELMTALVSEGRAGMLIVCFVGVLGVQERMQPRRNKTP